VTNLAQTQAEWNQLGRELGAFTGPMKELRDKERKFDIGSNRIQAVDFKNNGVDFTSAWTFAGAKIGYNTSEKGELFVRIADETPGAGQAQVSLYRATGAGGGDLVAQGSGADGATITLAQQNASGLTATVKIPTVTSSEANDKHFLLIFPDWQLRKAPIFNDTKPEHGTLKNAFDVACQATQASIEAGISAWETALATFLETRFADFMGSSTSSEAIVKKANVSDGAVQIVNTGLLEDGRDNMVDEATAGPQKVVQNVVTPSAPVFDAVNQGRGTMATPTMAQYASDGPMEVVCLDDTLGAEEFSVTQRRTYQRDSIQAENRLRIKRRFADPVLGIVSMTLLRSITRSAGSAADVTSGGAWAVDGEDAGNTDAGKIYLKVGASGGGFILSKIAIGAGANGKNFAYSFMGGAVQGVIIGGGAATAAAVAIQLNADTTFSAHFIAADDGTGKLKVSLKNTVDGEWGRIERGVGSSFNDQGGAGQDTFTDGTTIGNFRLDGYSASSLSATTQVFTTTGAAAGSSVTITPENSSGMSGTGVLGTNPTPGNTATVDLQVFSAENSSNVPDKITIAVSSPNSGRGEFQDRLAEIFGYGLNPGAAGTETINEGYVTAGTFPPYSVRDA
jgi:hypothetical protein